MTTNPADMRISGWWDAVMYLVILQAVILMGWWMYQAVDPNDLRASFTVFSAFNVGTLLVQWAVVLGAFLLLNRWIARKTVPEAEAGGVREPRVGTDS